jgi:hypothetical protein
MERREKGEGEENGGDNGNKGWSLRGISLGRGEGKRVGKQKERGKKGETEKSKKTDKVKKSRSGKGGKESEKI